MGVAVDCLDIQDPRGHQATLHKPRRLALVGLDLGYCSCLASQVFGGGNI